MSRKGSISIKVVTGITRYTAQFVVEYNQIVSVLPAVAVERPYSYMTEPGQGVLSVGDIVTIPLGTRLELGVVWKSTDTKKKVTAAKLRAITEQIATPPLSGELVDFVERVAAYTLSPLGMVLRMVLRSRNALSGPKPRQGVRFTGREPQRMTTARERVLEISRNGLAWSKRDLAEAAGVSPAVVTGLVKAGSLDTAEMAPEILARDLDAEFTKVEFSQLQESAAQQLRDKIGASYSTTLLHGVTGSGKTEVYFEAVAEILEQEKQALILLPEIALTGQFLARFEARFGARPLEWHSSLTPHRRERAWSAVHRGEAQIVVGARSALFLPFHDLGLIVVDEEHDPAYKQSDRVTYHARDMAVMRGYIAKIPVVLASATPSIETRVNVDAGKYGVAKLPTRFSGQPLPDIRLIDLRAAPPPRGNWLSSLLVEAISDALSNGRQALLFLNRRGYAPLTLCRKCGYRFMCPQCSSWLVQHRFRHQLQCHHCGYAISSPKICPSCKSEDSLVPCGPGVERIADEARAIFPDARIAVLSSDLIHSISEMHELFAAIEAGKFDIIVGTQLIAKGHHFPLLSVVGVVDADLGLGQGDLRAAERTFQLLHQVVGRAGRESVPGTGYLQTHMPEHPVMEALARGDEDEFYVSEIEARKRFVLPPFGHLAGLLITGKDKDMVARFARKMAQAAPAIKGVTILGPAEAPLGLVRGRHRYRMLVKAGRGVDLQSFLRHWLDLVGKPKNGMRVSVDIDPMSFA